MGMEMKKKARVAMLILNKIDFRTKAMMRQKGCFIMINQPNERI